MATLKDVAALANVHPSTVSRAIRGVENIPITDKTRKKIMDAVKQLNYEPDQRARALRLGKSDTIGLIIPDISNSFFAEIAKSIEEESYKTGYNLVVCVTNENQDKEIKFVQNLLNRGIDGLIIAPAQDSYRHLMALKKKNYPFVLIDRCFEEFETNAVISDNEAAAFEAVEYLANLGHHRIAFLSGRPTIYTIRKRLEGYKNAVKLFELDKDSELISRGGFTVDDGYNETLKLLSLERPPSAILVSGNRITIGALKASVEKGFSIPEDISIIGFTDSIVAPYLMTPLSSISHPLQDMGRRAFELLLEHINSKGTLPFSKIIVKTQLHIRESILSLKNARESDAPTHKYDTDITRV